MHATDRDPTPDPGGMPAPFDPGDSWRLIRMRWLAGLAMLIGTVGAAVFDQALPTLQLIVLSLAVLGYNAAMAVAMRRAGAQRLSLIVNGQIIFDWIALASFVHLTGGIESPAIFFFLFHLILVAMVFSARVTYQYAAMAIGLVIAIAVLEAIGWLPHFAVLIPQPSDLYRAPTYIVAIVGFFSVTVSVVVFLATRLMRELRNRERRLTALMHTLQVMPSSLDLTQVLNQIVVSVTHALEVKAASIRLLDEAGEQLTIAAAYGLSQAYLEKGPVTLAHSPIDQEALRGQPVIIDKTSQEQRFIYPEHILAEGIHSMMYAPLIGRRGPLGVLRVYRRQTGSFDAKDAEFVMTAARQGALAIENAMAYGELQRADETKSQFVRTVTHELRSPVVGAQSLLRTVTRDLAGTLNDTQRDILQRISNRLDVLKQLIDDLLDLAAGKVEGLQEAPTPIAVEAVVLAVIDRFSHQAEEKHIDLKLEYVPRGLTVMATEDGLSRIFHNLIGNAVKYTPPGGKVEVRMDQCGDEIVTAIIDNGVGIPAADLPHVFEEFYRASNVKQNGITGTGLGLAIVKDLVRHYEGRISVHSTVGEGTTFTVVLPMAR